MKEMAILDKKLDFVKRFSQLERLGVEEFLSIWLEDIKAYRYFDLSYEEDDCAKFQYNWDGNEGFEIDGDEYFDHLTVSTGGEIIIATTTKWKLTYYTVIY